MTATTVFGHACRVGDVVALRTRSGTVTGGYTIDDLDLELDGTDVDLDHDRSQVVGTIVHASISKDDVLGLVCVLDDDAIRHVEADMYFSGSYQPDEPYDPSRSFVLPRARLASVALVARSANSSARPVQWLPGDIRDAATRNGWPISWKHQYPLLADALDHQPGTWLTRSATRIIDRRRSYDDYMPRLSSVQLSQLARAQPTDGIRHSAHRGRILRVR